MDVIFFLVVVKIVYFKKYGFDEILKFFLNDLKIFEDGYYFIVGNSNIFITGVFLVFCGDILVFNFVGGFKEGVLFVMKCCRYCEVN